MPNTTVGTTVATMYTMLDMDKVTAAGMGVTEVDIEVVTEPMVMVAIAAMDAGDTQCIKPFYQGIHFQYLRLIMNCHMSIGNY